jgi:hypothetical protein
LEEGVSYQLIFHVQNVGGISGGNPAAFLAEITSSPPGQVTGDLLTSINWMYAPYEAYDPDTLDFNDMTWTAVTEFGNNGGPNIWGDVREGTSYGGARAVPGISTDAQWIWAKDNFGGLKQADLWIRGVIVPEPCSLIVWSLIGGFGIGGAWLRRKKRAV